MSMSMSLFFSVSVFVKSPHWYQLSERQKVSSPGKTKMWCEDSKIKSLLITNLFSKWPIELPKKYPNMQLWRTFLDWSHRSYKFNFCLCTYLSIALKIYMCAIKWPFWQSTKSCNAKIFPLWASKRTAVVHLSRKTALCSNLSTFCFHELIHKDLPSTANIFINLPKMIQRKAKKS